MALKKVSLKTIVEKLFIDEKLECFEYQEYVKWLLANANTDHLKGLSMENFVWDIMPVRDDGVFNLPELIASRKDGTTIKNNQNIWYVNSIYQLNTSKINNSLIHKAFSWNIINLRAATYLLALPSLQNNHDPNIEKKVKQQKEYHDHLSTIRRLFDYFRKANNVLLEGKKYKKKHEYLKIWETHLPCPDVSLKQFLEGLNNSLKDSSLSGFERHMLNDLRVIFTYVFNHQIRLVNSKSLRVTSKNLDDQGIVKEVIEVPSNSSSTVYATHLEEQLDEKEVQTIEAVLKDVTPLAEYSISAQRYVLPLVAQYVQRQAHQFSCSSLIINPSTIQELVQKLYQDAHQPFNIEKSALVLLLSFLTGIPPQHWLKVQTTSVRKLNALQKLVKIDDSYVIRTKFSIFYDKKFPYSNALLNQTIQLDLPIPKNLIQQLKTKPAINEQHLKKYLSQLRQYAFIPHFTLSKISHLLHHVIFRNTGNKQLADILTGINVNHSSSTAYSHYPIATLHHHYLKVLENICRPLATLYPPNHQDKEQNFGSGKGLKPQIVNNIFSTLKYKIFSTPENDWIHIFNYYNLWMWHFLLLFTAARPVQDFPGFLKHIDLQRQIMMISDKENAGRHGDGRVIPLCDFATQEIKKFLQFLDFIKMKMKFLQPHIYEEIDATLKSNRPLLNIYINNRLISLNASLVKQQQPELGLEYANWHRHTVRAFLTQKISEPHILALFGHEEQQQEAAHLYSSFSMSTYKQLAIHLESMKEYFNISGIEVHAICQ